MEIYSNRRWYTDNSTISELFIDENPTRICYILEPTTRAGTDPRGIIAIPTGRYEVTLYNSPKHGRIVPILNNIPGHNYVEIHTGNTEVDTLDCLLPGLTMAVDDVGQSIDAFNILFPLIDKELNTKQVFINIKNEGA